MKPTITRDICGTHKGYRKHYRQGEERCRPCVDAFNAYHRTYRAGREHAMTLEELTAEVEWQLSCAQGEHAILRALGYTKNPATLERRLARAKRHDLIPKIFQWKAA